MARVCAETSRHDALHTDSMHPQQHNIEWDEDYDEPGMRPYPLLPVVCVRAQMGLGKTRCLKTLVQENCGPETRALVVTFSRALSAKLYAEFAPQGFFDYQSKRGPIDEPKVVVCLDSLWRVTTREFDFVFIDEAVSVFLHLNSPLMARSVENTAILSDILKGSQYAYFLDACLDTTFVKQIVEFFAGSKGALPYWIRNRYVRPTNRRIRCHVRFGNGFNNYGLQKLAMARVVALLTLGKRVVVCSSTKKFTTALRDHVREERPRTKMLVYNGDTGGADLVDVATVWTKVDLLVYSPTITAGVSFEVPHFDSLVSYFANSSYTPGVDIALQQLFRVRCLNDGDMHMYISDSCPDEMLPHTDAEVEKLLRDDGVDVSKLISGGIDHKADLLSHIVVKGIVSMQNRSASNYTAILLRTLREDYGIPCARVDSNDRDLDVRLPERESVDALPFDKAFKMASAYGHDCRDEAASRLHFFATRLWGVPLHKVDAGFYDLLVMHPESAERYMRAKRFKLCCTQSYAANHQELEICQDAAERASIQLLLEGQKLLQDSGAPMKTLKGFRPVKVPAAPDFERFRDVVHRAFGLAARRLSAVPGDPGYGTMELAPSEFKRIKDAWSPWFLRF